MSARTVLVLGGGPDAERDVSVRSAAAVAEALRASGRFDVRAETIDRIDAAALASLTGDVIFPVLHGPWGEGGGLQDVLDADGRPYVGSGPRAARLCMDKLATKLAAAGLGIATPPAAAVNPGDAGSVPIGPPVVIKPAHEGSSVGLHVCADEPAVREALRVCSADRSRVWMVERYCRGRELTAGVIDNGDGALKALPLVEIVPHGGVYDFDAKYARGDTRYIVGPDVADGVREQVQREAVRLCEAAGVRHLARVDFMLDREGRAWLLEVNTMPGFTGSSLLPKAAAAAGLDLPALCARFVDVAAGCRAGV